MTPKKYLLAAFAASILLITPSCSIFDFNKKSTSKVQTALPHDRVNIAKKSDPLAYTPDELRRGVVKGDWAIETVYGHHVVGEEAPFLKFEPTEKKVYGNNGCNVINASYRYNPTDSVISFSNLLATMKLCNKEGITDYEINSALGSTKYYSWRMAETDYYITFYDESGAEVMTLMHQNFDFLNGTWKVDAINDEKINVPDMKLVIDIDEGKLHGNTGCNVINGNVEIDMDKPNSISFSAIGMTKMMCRDATHETALLVALEEATAARPVSGSQVILYDSMHRPVLTLTRTTDQ